MKIFLSHTNADKPVIEPIALRLRDIFGEQNVFYDAWSIQPGDGIIAKMNEGLEAPDFVFFFVSAQSLKSKMVELEWQNSLYKSTKGHVKIVPVRVDGEPMPSLMMQNVWIDLYSHGIEVALQQIVSVVQGQSTFTPQHVGFSNLTWSLEHSANKAILTVSASHLMEPTPRVMVATFSGEHDIKVTLANGSPSIGGFNENISKTDDGRPYNGFAIAPMGGAITPKHPLRIEIENNDISKSVQVIAVFHHEGEQTWRPIPQRQAQSTS